MNKFLKELSERRRFGMKPGLETITALCAALGDPQRKLRNVIHVAGTNGKGAVCAILDAALGAGSLASRSAYNGVGAGVARYTSPHLVKLNERFFLNGAPLDDATLESAAAKVALASPTLNDVTFFEALTAVAFVAFADADPDWTILETGLGGRLDATNICSPRLCVITKIGLDHCDWLGDTVEKIAAEKAGIIKPGVPVVLAKNEPAVIEVIRRAAAEKGAPFYYAPELADESEIPEDFPLLGAFNRENCVTALAALKVIKVGLGSDRVSLGSDRVRQQELRVDLSGVVWPGRFQRVGEFLVDGAHNPPAARALASALSSTSTHTLTLSPSHPLTLIAGFCGDKDALEVLKILRPFVARGFAVRTNNPRSLSAEATAALMREAGIPSEACGSLKEAIGKATDGESLASRSAYNGGARNLEAGRPEGRAHNFDVLICGSLFLAGEAIVELGAYPWGSPRFDSSELLKP